MPRYREEALWTELAVQGAVHEDAEFKTELTAELLICFTALAHGTKKRPYGALITSGPPAPSVGTLLTCAVDPQELRAAAEGRTLLISRWRGAPLRLLRLAAPLPTDDDCAALVASTGGVLVRAQPDGSVSLIGARSISYIDGHEVWSRPHVNAVVGVLLDAAPRADPSTLTALATLAYSYLSPARIGATLVYQLTDEDDVRGHYNGAAVEPLGFNVNDATHLSAILNQVEHRDGAAVFRRTGILRRAGVILVPSPKAIQAVGAVRGGTRHKSAAWHSFDREDVLCFVVSTARRVSVFTNGEDLLARSDRTLRHLTIPAAEARPDSAAAQGIGGNSR